VLCGLTPAVVEILPGYAPLTGSGLRGTAMRAQSYREQNGAGQGGP